MIGIISQKLKSIDHTALILIKTVVNWLGEPLFPLFLLVTSNPPYLKCSHIILLKHLEFFSANIMLVFWLKTSLEGKTNYLKTKTAELKKIVLKIIKH